MKLGIIQLNQEWENPENNIVRINELIASEVTDEEILIFPEMTLTGFTMRADKFGEEIDGVGTKYFIHLSDKFQKHIFAGIIEKDNGKYYNNLIHFDPNGLIAARYRKIHPFTREADSFLPGTEPLITKIDKFTVGLAVCYDLRFPELYRFYAKSKVDMLLTIANWPVPRVHHWKHLLRARAIENQCFSVGVNRVGKDPYNEYNGGSAVYDPAGNELVCAENEEKLISVEIDPQQVSEVRNQLNFLDDIRLI